MKKFTVRNMETGAIQMTGFWCETEEEAVLEYCRLFPQWEPEELYAAEED